MDENPTKVDAPAASGDQIRESTPESTKTNLEIEKLNLEIDSLKKKMGLEVEKLGYENTSLKKKNRFEPVLQLVPVVTSAIATIGLVMGLILSQQAQKREQETKGAERRDNILSKISTDEEEILRFAQDKNQTLARVSLLFRNISNDMKSVLGSQDRRPFTESLVTIIIKELDFEKSPRDVGFARVTLANWEDYTTYLRENPEKLKYVLSRYVSALSYLDESNPSYFQDLKYYAPTNEYIVMPKYETQQGEKQLYQHFIEIRDGFKEHLKLARNDHREQSIRDFEAVLCNETIAKQIFGPDFTGQTCAK
jgi:hypothetical protein